MIINIERFYQKWNVEVEDIADFSDAVYPYVLHEHVQDILNQLEKLAGYEADETEVIDSLVDDTYAMLIEEGVAYFGDLTIRTVKE